MTAMQTISLLMTPEGDAVPISAVSGESTTNTEVPQFWQDYAAAQADNMDMLVILLSLIIGLLLCVILKRR